MTPIDLLEQFVHHGLLGALLGCTAALLGSIVYILQRLDDGKRISAWTIRAIISLVIVTTIIAGLYTATKLSKTLHADAEPSSAQPIKNTSVPSSGTAPQNPNIDGNHPPAGLKRKTFLAKPKTKPPAPPPSTEPAVNCHDEVHSYLEDGLVKSQNETVCGSH